jgi:hypothetical protein
MKRPTYLSLSFVFLLSSSASALVQSQPQPTKEPTPDKSVQGSYIRKSVGTEKSEADTAKNDPFSTIPIESWVGERFIFLPRQKSLREYGYQSIHKPKHEFSILPYDKYVGRIAKVTAVTPSKTGLSSAYEIELTLEDTGEKVRAEAVSRGVKGLALVRDIDNARALYLGKTLRLKEPFLRTYNEATGKNDVIVAADSLIKVIDIVAGWDEESPVRFVVKTSSGEEGFVDVSMSDTNVSEYTKAYKTYNKFEKSFLIESAQIVRGSENSRTRTITDEEVQELTKRAETYFREGEAYLRDKKPALARQKFDSAVETILASGVNLQNFEGLRKYYDSLVERINRLETPAAQTSSQESGKPQSTNTPQVGFRDQKFEPSPNDKLSKLVLTDEESPAPNRKPVLTKQEEDALLGLKPEQSTNGKVPIVMKWFQENLHDPYSMRIVRWSKVEKQTFPNEPYWVVRVRLRAKNSFGAYVLNEYSFFIRHNKIVRFVN